jgi:hypothetical protein
VHQSARFGRPRVAGAVGGGCRAREGRYFVARRHGVVASIRRDHARHTAEPAS